MINPTALLTCLSYEHRVYASVFTSAGSCLQQINSDKANVLCLLRYKQQALTVGNNLLKKETHQAAKETTIFLSRWCKIKAKEREVAPCTLCLCGQQTAWIHLLMCNRLLRTGHKKYAALSKMYSSLKVLTNAPTYVKFF